MTITRKNFTALLVAGVLAASLAGCGSGTNTTASSTSSRSGEITVFAAASLKAPFTQLDKDF
jgi:molybdate transport system substrate-binding protein